MHRSDVEPLGAEWKRTSSIWGKRCGDGDPVDQVSPLDGALIQKACFISRDETSRLFETASPAIRLAGASLRGFCSRLHDELCALYPHILEATQWETAFTRHDCEDVVHSSLEYVGGFPDHLAGLPRAQIPPLGYSDDDGQRRIELVDVPWGTVAVILPQSAFLFLSVTCLLNALAAGNRVILRAPAQSARSAALLSLAVDRAKPPAESVSIVLVSARTFVAALCESGHPILLH
jgi:acyl-CoA reductase-like NAD-dependent aldehyde dehydrogenase